MPVARCQVVPPSSETSTAATTPPPVSDAVPVTLTTLPLVIELPAVGEVIVATGGVVSVDCDAGCSVSSSVPGWAPMSARMLTVACCMSSEGAGPVPSWWQSSPHDHRMVPAENTSAPLRGPVLGHVWVAVPVPQWVP